MGNSLPEPLLIGTIGEILVQLRLLEYGIQSAPPIKDSGNDLIAIKNEVVKFIQVKTSSRGSLRPKNLPEIYHIVAIVDLKYSENGLILLDSSNIYFYKKGDDYNNRKELSRELIEDLWRQ